MKNKFYYILVLFLVSFSFMNIVFAEDENAFDLEFDFVVDNTEVVVGDEISVMIQVKSDAAISECLVKVEPDSNIEFIEAKGANSWNVAGDGLGVNGISTEISITQSGASVTDFTRGEKILALKYKVNGSGSLKIASSSYCTNGTDDVYAKEKSISLTTKNLNEVTTLSSLKVNGKELDSFSPSKYSNYAVQLANPTFSIEYETTNPDFRDDVVVTTLDGTEITDLNNVLFNDPTNQGMMIINVVVNNTTTYTFMARYEAKELDNSLKSLKINGQVVDLKPGQLEGYSIKVGKDVTSVKVEAVLADSTNFKFALQETGTWDQTIQGTNTNIPIEIVPVSSQSGGTSATYIIEVIREGGTGASKPTSTPTSKPTVSQGEVDKNPQTGNISMFVMALILISSLVGSVMLYQKNIESYK